MNKFYLYLTFVICLFFSISCGDDPIAPTPDPVDEGIELAAPVLSSSTATAAISKDDLKKEALKLSWTSALDSDKDVTVIYTVYSNLASKDLYSSPKTFSAGGQLQYSFSGEDINALVTELGGEAGTEQELQFSVYARTDDDDVESVVSNIVKVKVTTVKEEIVFPSALWIAGSATDAGWDVSKGIEMPKGNDGKYKAENVNLNVTITDTGFKLYFANDGSSNVFIGPDRSAEVFGTAMVYTEDDGSANLFQPAMNGYKSGKYTITFDPSALKVTITRTGDIEVDITGDLGDNVYPLGNCFSWGWSFTDPMTKVSDKVYEIKTVKCQWGDKGDSGFKIFLANGKWSPYFAMTEDSTNGKIGIRLVTDSEAPQFYPGMIGYASGYYTIRADFNTMTLTLTAEEDPTPVDNSFYIVGGGFTKYAEWSFLPELALSDADNDGVYVTDNAVLLNKWCYFRFAKKDYKEDYSRNTKATNYWTAQAKATGDEEPFIPGNADSNWADGLYTVSFNTKDLSVTCTPVNTGVDQAKAFYLYGEFKGSYSDWAFDDDLALMPLASDANVYETVKAVNLNEWSYFKFEKRDWTEYVRDTTVPSTQYWTVTARTHEPDNDSGFSPGSAGLGTGTYKVRLDLNSKTVTLTKVE